MNPHRAELVLVANALPGDMVPLEKRGDSVQEEPENNGIDFDRDSDFDPDETEPQPAREEHRSEKASCV
jgi:hypothetical protein